MDRQEHLRIVQVITGSDYIGGAETHVRDLTAGLQSCGHECTVLCGPPDGLFCSQLRGRGIQVRIVPSLRKPLSARRDGMALSELIGELRRVRPDIIAAHTAKAGFLGRLAAAAVRIPCVVTPHGLSIIDRKTGTIRKSFVALERLAGPFGRKLITVCEHEWRLAESAGIVGNRKLAMVHNGIVDGQGLADPAREPSVITTIARFEPPKDHETLVRALAELKDGPAWVAVLIGDGSRRENIRSLASKLGIANRIQFAGECADAAGALADSQMFVLSTRMEAFPMSILEAMRAGLPVVASNVGGIPEAVEDQKTGFLTPAGDHVALAGRIRTLLTDREKRRQMGLNGRARYLERFTARHMVASTLAVYSEVLEHRTGQHSVAARIPLQGNSVSEPEVETSVAAGGFRN